jgi:hypothetical protein
LNLTEITNKLIELRKQGNRIVTAKDLQNLQKFDDTEIDVWFKPNYVAIGTITLATLFCLQNLQILHKETFATFSHRSSTSGSQTMPGSSGNQKPEP